MMFDKKEYDCFHQIYVKKDNTAVVKTYVDSFVIIPRESIISFTFYGWEDTSAYKLIKIVLLKDEMHFRKDDVVNVSYGEEITVEMIEKGNKAVKRLTEFMLHKPNPPPTSLEQRMVALEDKLDLLTVFSKALDVQQLKNELKSSGGKRSRDEDLLH